MHDEHQNAHSSRHASRHASQHTCHTCVDACAQRCARAVDVSDAARMHACALPGTRLCARPCQVPALSKHGAKDMDTDACVRRNLHACSCSGTHERTRWRCPARAAISKVVTRTRMRAWQLLRPVHAQESHARTTRCWPAARVTVRARNQDSSWHGGHHARAPALAHLRPARRASVHARVLDAAAAAKLGALLLDLHRQLARGRHNQHNWPVAALWGWVWCGVVVAMAEAGGRRVSRPGWLSADQHEAHAGAGSAAARARGTSNQHAWAAATHTHTHCPSLSLSASLPPSPR